MMVPMTSNEIFFLGGFRNGGTSGEVSVLDLVNLKLNILANNPDYRFDSTNNCCFNVSKSGEISAVVRSDRSALDVISFSKSSKKIKVLQKRICD